MYNIEREYLDCQERIVTDPILLNNKVLEICSKIYIF